MTVLIRTIKQECIEALGPNPSREALAQAVRNAYRKRNIRPTESLLSTTVDYVLSGRSAFALQPLNRRRCGED